MPRPNGWLPACRYGSADLQHAQLVVIRGPLTDYEISRLLGISRGRVWIIAQRALAKLKKRLEGVA
jgi:DNA-directed RNA polymerase specialized sigma24 family protein